MNRKSQKDKRKALRNSATISEKRLWKFLNKKQQGLKFRRQHGIGPFIVDFYATQYKLAIELDGRVHNNIMRQAYDQKREDYLKSYGIKVIRFTNDQVKYNVDEVIRKIMFECGYVWPPRSDELRSRNTPPLPSGRRGDFPTQKYFTFPDKT